VKLRIELFTEWLRILILARMRHNDAKCDRSHRWIEGRSGLSSMRVTSHGGVGRAASFGFLPKGAFPTV
jgi:hypothetical protein